MHYACKVCQLGVDIDPTMTNAAISRQLDVSKDSVRRHKAHMAKQTDTFFTDVPVASITQRRTTRRLPDGSYERVTWNPNRATFLEALSYDDIERAIDGFVAPSRPKIGSGSARTLHLADLQLGKTDWNGGTPETVARVMQAVDKFVALCEAEQPSVIVVSDNGDPIEGVFNVDTQRFTNDLDVPAQIRAFRRLAIEVLKRVGHLAPEVYYVAVPSNHGAFRVGYKSQGGTTDADFGLEIAAQLEDVCAESPALRHIHFVTPDPMQEVLTLDVANTRLAYTHGHLSPSFKTHGAWWAKTDHGRLPGWDADILVTAHYHSLRVEQSGDGRWIIGVSSPDPGSSWYSKKTGESSISGITTFAVRDGQWSALEIL